MSYTHLTTDEAIMIEKYHDLGIKVAAIALKVGRSRQTVYNVVNFLKSGGTVPGYLLRYKSNKKRCGRKPTELSDEEKAHVAQKASEGWNPQVIKGRSVVPLPCSERTLYRLFERGIFNVGLLPMKEKRKPNGHVEKRGKQPFRRGIRNREADYPGYETEFGHLEGDTIVGSRHQSAVITLVERQSKAIIALKPEGRTAMAVEEAIKKWADKLPRNLFKSITFDCGKEFSNWKSVCNHTDMDIYFADPGTPSQRALNENSNGLLRRGGLAKGMDFSCVDQSFVSAVADKRNNIPRKSLGFRTPLEVLTDYVDERVLSSLY